MEDATSCHIAVGRHLLLLLPKGALLLLLLLLLILPLPGGVLEHRMGEGHGWGGKPPPSLARTPRLLWLLVVLSLLLSQPLFLSLGLLPARAPRARAGTVSLWLLRLPSLLLPVLSLLLLLLLLALGSPALCQCRQVDLRTGKHLGSPHLGGCALAQSWSLQTSSRQTDLQSFFLLSAWSCTWDPT